MAAGKSIARQTQRGAAAENFVGWLLTILIDQTLTGT